jgi:hypothetical protein
MKMMSAAAGPKREFVQLMEHHKRKTELERDAIEQEM